MDNSQTSVKKDTGEDKPIQGDTPDDESSDYYYDDATGYETYDENDDEDEADGDSEA